MDSNSSIKSILKLLSQGSNLPPKLHQLACSLPIISLFELISPNHFLEIIYHYKSFESSVIAPMFIPALIKYYQKHQAEITRFIEVAQKWDEEAKLEEQKAPSGKKKKVKRVALEEPVQGPTTRRRLLKAQQKEI